MPRPSLTFWPLIKRLRKIASLHSLYDSGRRKFCGTILRQQLLTISLGTFWVAHRGPPCQQKCNQWHVGSDRCRFDSSEHRWTEVAHFPRCLRSAFASLVKERARINARQVQLRIYEKWKILGKAMKTSLISGKELVFHFAFCLTCNAHSILTSDLEEVFSLELL